MAPRPTNCFHSAIYPYSQGALDNRDNYSHNTYKRFHPFPEISFLTFSLGSPLDISKAPKQQSAIRVKEQYLKLIKKTILGKL